MLQIIIILAWIFITVVQGSRMYTDLYKAMPLRCREQKPMQVNYKPTGRRLWIDNMDIYETGAKESRNVLIAAYDIFGFHPNTLHFADMIAEKGPFTVVMPDFFRRRPYLMEDYPNLNTKLAAFLEDQGNWDHAKKTLMNVINFYKAKGFPNFALYGHCWGGWVGGRSAGQINDLKAVGIVHAYGVTEEDVRNMAVPGYFLPCSDDPDMEPLYTIMKAKFGNRCGHERLDDMTHGFTSGRGNYSDPANFKRVVDVINIFTNFFNDSFKQQNYDTDMALFEFSGT